MASNEKEIAMNNNYLVYKINYCFKSTQGIKCGKIIWYDVLTSEL